MKTVNELRDDREDPREALIKLNDEALKYPEFISNAYKYT